MIDEENPPHVAYADESLGEMVAYVGRQDEDDSNSADSDEDGTNAEGSDKGTDASEGGDGDDEMEDAEHDEEEPAQQDEAEDEDGSDDEENEDADEVVLEDAASVSEEGSAWEDNQESTGSSESDEMIAIDDSASEPDADVGWEPHSVRMMEKVTKLIREDPCAQKCLQGKAAQLEKFIASIEAMTSDQKKTSLLTALAILQEDESAAPKRKRSTGERKRFAYHLPMVGQVCHAAFVQCYATSAPTISRYRKQIMNGHFAVKPHAGTGNTNARRIDTAWIKAWFDAFGKSVGEVVPVRVRRYKTVDGTVVRYNSKAEMTLIPSAFTWDVLYEELKAYAELEQVDEPLPAFSTFRAALSKTCPNIKIRSPRSNVCDICCIYKAELNADPSADTAEKMGEHVEDAKQMRLEYQRDLERASDDHIVLTMDYAQNLTVPSIPETPSQWYFLSLLSVSVFGVHIAHKKEQVNFVYSELKGGKGSNEVISLISRVLEIPARRHPTKTLTIFADNCGGQNKNNFVLKFLLLLVDGGFFREVQLKFLVKGHTKNACDGGFGIIKKHVSRFASWTIPDLVKNIENASVSTVAVGLDSEDEFCFSDYKTMVTKLYKNLKGIQQFQLFRFRRGRSGIVECRRRPSDVPVEHDLRKKVAGEFVVPEVLSKCLSKPLLRDLPPPKRNVEKMHDIYSSIVPYVPSEFTSDPIYAKPDDEQLEGAKTIKRARREAREEAKKSTDPSESTRCVTDS